MGAIATSRHILNNMQCPVGPGETDDESHMLVYKKKVLGCTDPKASALSNGQNVVSSYWNGDHHDKSSFKGGVLESGWYILHF